jgi:peptidoglycan/xylan/chitin deacetylase (PgdA/CDA1 family)
MRKIARCAVLGSLALFVSVGATQPPASPAHKTIAITIDDLPMQAEGFSVRQARQHTARLLAALRRHRVVATGFVNEDKLFVSGEVDTRIGLLDAWLDAGMDLGNHNFGHLGFEETPLAAYEESVVKGDIVTRQLLARRGRSPRYYRYPFNQTGPSLHDRDAFLSFLKEHGYAVAPVTIEHDDSIFGLVYAEAIKTGDHKEASAVVTSYLANLDKAVAAFEQMSAQLFGRQISQVFLIHANRLNADTLDRTLTRLEANGYRFISLDQALSDPAYTSPDGYVGKYGPSWLRRWADGLHRKIRPLGQPDPDAWVQRRYDVIARRGN